MEIKKATGMKATSLKIISSTFRSSHDFCLHSLYREPGVRVCELVHVNIDSKCVWGYKSAWSEMGLVCAGVRSVLTQYNYRYFCHHLCLDGCRQTNFMFYCVLNTFTFGYTSLTKRKNKWRETSYFCLACLEKSTFSQEHLCHALLAVKPFVLVCACVGVNA